MDTSSLARSLWVAGLACGVLSLAACGRQEAPVAPAAAEASSPVIRGVASQGAASQTADKTNSTSALGTANLPEPPSSDNPASSPSPVAAASQSVSATTLGTSPMPGDGTLANPGQGSTNTRGLPGTK